MNTNSYGHDPSLRPTPQEIPGRVGQERVVRIIHGALNGRQNLVVQFGEAVTRDPEIQQAVPLTAEQWGQASQKAATTELSAMTGDKKIIAPQGSDVANSASRNQGHEATAELDTIAILADIEKIRAEAGN